jgi:hypothetical protein
MVGHLSRLSTFRRPATGLTAEVPHDLGNEQAPLPYLPSVESFGDSHSQSGRAHWCEVENRQGC